MVIKASDYGSRQDLEAYIRNELGDDIGANRLAGHSIQGDAETLRSLGLSESTRIYGVKVAVNN